MTSIKIAPPTQGNIADLAKAIVDSVNYSMPHRRRFLHERGWEYSIAPDEPDKTPALYMTQVPVKTAEQKLRDLLTQIVPVLEGGIHLPHTANRQLRMALGICREYSQALRCDYVGERTDAIPTGQHGGMHSRCVLDAGHEGSHFA